MIDVHCHILPGIDDGALDMSTSLEMLRKAEKAGITDVILTPHYIRNSIYNADNMKKWQLLKELTKKAKEDGIKVRLYLGNEVYIDSHLPEMLAGYVGEESEEMYEVATLNSSRYVLVEFPVRTEDKTAKETLFTLVQKGLIPVIAHPERYIYIQEDISYLDDLIGMGCLLQGDYLSLTGRYGKHAEKTLKKLLKEDKIFCLASDLHKATDEYQVRETRKKLLKIVDSAKIKELVVDNPEKILHGVI